MRKKIGKLPFVDRSRNNQGVSFDSKYQMLHFATNGSEVDPKGIAKAVKEAGFDPVTLYILKGKVLKKTSLEKLSK